MIKHNAILLLLLLLLLSLVIKPLQLRAQENLSTLYNLTTLEGLPNNGVETILKDSRGYMWFGTKSGLCRFDGHDIKNYPQLNEEEILTLEELTPNILLIGTSSTIYQYDQIKNTFNLINNFGKSIRINSIKKINDEIFLLGTNFGLYIQSNQGKANKLVLNNGISSSNYVNSIIRENENIFWVATANGLGKYDLNTKKSFFYKMPENVDNSNNFRCLTKQGANIYIGSLNRGVFCFNTQSNTFSKIYALGNDFILSIVSNNNKLFVGTDGKGLRILSLKKMKLEYDITKKKGIIKSNTISALSTSDGILWIGTLSNGISYTPSVGSNFSMYKKGIFNSSDYNVRSIYIFNNGDKLIGTRSGLIFISNQHNIIKEFSTEDGSSNLRSDIILDIEDLGGQILIGTYGGGIYRFNKETLTLSNFSHDFSFLHGCFFRLTIDKTGDFWFATDGGLIHCSPQGKIIHKYDTSNSGLADNIILFLFIDSRNRVWMSTHFGIFVLESETGRMQSDLFSKENNQLLSRVNYILEDSKKHIWLCANQGLIKTNLDLTTTDCYTNGNLFPEKTIKNAIEDNDGNIWFATQTHLMLYNPQTNYFAYEYLEGLVVYDFNNNVQKDNNGTIWWANEAGLLYTNVKNQNQKKCIIYRPTITSYVVSNVEYNPLTLKYPDKIILENDNNNIQLKFSYMNYSLPNADVFEYKLVGYDSIWRSNIGKNEAIYRELPTGEYIFKLRSPQNNSVEKDIYIKVKRSYTEIIWIAVLVIISAVFLITFLSQIKKLRIKIRKERLILADVQEQGKVIGTLTIPDEKVKKIVNQLMVYMQEDKPFLNIKLKIKDVADKLECNPSELSQVLNTRLDVNFTDFINVYRVNEFKSRLDNKQNLSKFTLKGLSEICGFNSKSTFYRAFKKVTGTTPIEYCKERGIDISEN